MDTLPVEILRLISTYLSLEDRKILRLTCKRFRPFFVLLNNNDRYVFNTLKDLTNYNLRVKNLSIRLDVTQIREKNNLGDWEWANKGDFVEDIEIEICEYQDNRRVMLQVFKHFASLKTIHIELRPCCRGLKHDQSPHFTNADWVDLMGPQPKLESLTFECYQWKGFSMLAEPRDEFERRAISKWGSQLKEFRIGFTRDEVVSGPLLSGQIVCTDVFNHHDFRLIEDFQDFFHNYPNLKRAALKNLESCPHLKNLTHIQLSNFSWPEDVARLQECVRLEALSVTGCAMSSVQKKSLQCSYINLKIFMGTAEFIENIENNAPLEVLFLSPSKNSIPLQLICKQFQKMRCLVISDAGGENDVAIGDLNNLVGLVQFAWTNVSELPSDLHLLRLPLLEDLYLNMTLTTQLVFTLFANCPRLRNLYCGVPRNIDMTHLNDRGAFVYSNRRYSLDMYSIFRERRKMVFFTEKTFSQLDVANRRTTK